MHVPKMNKDLTVWDDMRVSNDRNFIFGWTNNWLLIIMHRLRFCKFTSLIWWYFVYILFLVIIINVHLSFVTYDFKWMFITLLQCHMRNWTSELRDRQIKIQHVQTTTDLFTPGIKIHLSYEGKTWQQYRATSLH